MIFKKLTLSGLTLVRFEPFKDVRGQFSRIFCDDLFSDAGLPTVYPQENHSVCKHRGTIRGLHLQTAPHSEAKLIRCTKGSIFDVVVDCRKGSPTLLQSHCIKLSENDNQALFIPGGFAHGYQAMSDNAEATYRSTSPYRPEFEQQIRYDDPLLRIEWPVMPAIVSDKDASCEFITDGFEGWAF